MSPVTAHHLSANVTLYNSTDATYWVEGWVASPDGRGTFDILQICVTTVFLCTYTTLYLNTVPKDEGRLAIFYHKTKWALFTVFSPEMIVGIAAEQWRAAQRSLEDFTHLQNTLETKKAVSRSSDESDLLARLKAAPWTARHAFLANMGGIHLDCPDFKPFPVNSHQVLWLVENLHVTYPSIAQDLIEDKNKADIFARVAKLLQITWFTTQSIIRGVDHLGITTLELSTIAFGYCTLNSFWFWRHKPLDVAEAIILECTKPLREIIRESGRNVGFYKQTPLDFVEPEMGTTYVAPFFWTVRTLFGFEGRPTILPQQTFLNTATVPNRGLKSCDLAFALYFSTAYFGIHLAAWDFPFPTSVERLLWRIAAMTLNGMVALFMFACWPGNHLIKYLWADRPQYALQQAHRPPVWVAKALSLPVLSVYCLARSYIIVEGFVSLRSLPATAFTSVSWWSLVPHL